MTQEDKQLLIKDLCARLPYGVKVYDDMGRTYTLNIGNSYLIDLFYENGDYVDVPIKPYLRPMSSMTEEERAIYESTMDNIDDFLIPNLISFDYLNSIHVDYRGLIPKGLAIEVNESNNPYNN